MTATRCEFSANKWDGVAISGGAKGCFTNCTFHHNGGDGVSAFGDGTLVELRGEQTESHHNFGFGVCVSQKATINIFCIPLPTSYEGAFQDNRGDLQAYTSGTIRFDSDVIQAAEDDYPPWDC